MNDLVPPTLSVLRRELAGYFVTPVAYIFIIVFLVLCGVATFQIGQFFTRGQADLMPFFGFHPWLYLFLIPALSMRLWAEERRAGTIELLMTLPIPPLAAVLGKFLAAWIFTGIALVLTVPLWITVNQLGEPDNGAIAAGYVGSLLMAGGFLAVGSVASAFTKSQVIALVTSALACFALLLAGFPPVIDLLAGWAPEWLVEQVSSFSFLTRFQNISKGVLDLRDIAYFVGLIVVLLIANVVVVELKKAD
ncbi:MAG: ABC transporter permease [Planctomycetota bacterium]